MKFRELMFSNDFILLPFLIQRNILGCITCLAAQSCLTFATPGTVARQAPLSMGFPRPEYWTGLPFSPAGDLPDSGIKLASSESPGLRAASSPAEPSGSPAV